MKRKEIKITITEKNKPSRAALENFTCELMKLYNIKTDTNKQQEEKAA